MFWLPSSLLLILFETSGCGVAALELLFICLFAVPHPVGKHEHGVAVDDGVEAVGDDEGGRSGLVRNGPLQPALNDRVRRQVHVGSRLKGPDCSPTTRPHQ
eukprot:1184833-Prorocentrum_minimum.AAC.2